MGAVTFTLLRSQRWLAALWLTAGFGLMAIVAAQDLGHSVYVSAKSDHAQVAWRWLLAHVTPLMTTITSGLIAIETSANAARFARRRRVTPFFFAATVAFSAAYLLGLAVVVLFPQGTAEMKVALFEKSDLPLTALGGFCALTLGVSFVLPAAGD